MACTFKVDFDGEIRRFTMPKNTDALTFEIKLKQLFPALGEKQFNIYYRDQEGDIVRIASTEELHHACQISGYFLRIIISLHKSEAQAVQPHRPPAGALALPQLGEWTPAQFMGDPFSFFDNPFSGLDISSFDLPLEQRQMRLKHKEEQLKTQREYENKVREMYKQRKEQREQFLKNEAERFGKEMDRRMNEDGDAPVKRSKSGTVVVAKPKVNQFGSWEPVSTSGPGWSQTSWGPVGYELHYFFPGEEDDKSSKSDDESKSSSQDSA